VRNKAPVLVLWIAGTWCLLFASVAFAQVPVPPLKARVTDLTDTLSAQQQARLERRLQAFEARRGSQIAVLLVPTTQPETIEQYSIRVVEDWKLGREGVDDGALLLIAKDDRAMRIEVGYGLEGALNDATAKRIIAEIITPYFRNGDFFAGIQAGVQAMIKVIEGEPLPASEPANDDGNSPASVLPGVVFFAFILGQIFRGIVGRLPAALGTAAVSTGIVWLLIGSLLAAFLSGLVIFAILIFSGAGTARSFGRGGYYSVGGLGVGGWGAGTAGGGGFRGAGGSFGGGGASGRW
jgi:uncharacterized protein